MTPPCIVKIDFENYYSLALADTNTDSKFNKRTEFKCFTVTYIY